LQKLLEIGTLRRALIEKESEDLRLERGKAKQASTNLKSNLDDFLTLAEKLRSLDPTSRPEILDFVIKTEGPPVVYKTKIKEGDEELAFSFPENEIATLYPVNPDLDSRN
jgi:hypothetical protein